MSITVLNTDAGLSGKTIVNTEDAQSISGLKTFDRDPNPPFAVSSGSDVVANLDADTVDGAHWTDWTSYTPTLTNLTIGNGTLTAKYAQFGKIVMFKLVITFGSTSSITNTLSISLPVTAAVGFNGSMIGSGEASDNSAGPQPLTGRINSSTTFIPLYTVQASGLNNTINTTAPFTWTTDDAISFSGVYEAA